MITQDNKMPANCGKLLLLLLTCSAFADNSYDDYDYLGSGSGDDECWGDGPCNPDVRVADSVDCLICPQVSIKGTGKLPLH